MKKHLSWGCFFGPSVWKQAHFHLKNFLVFFFVSFRGHFDGKNETCLTVCVGTGVLASVDQLEMFLCINICIKRCHLIHAPDAVSCFSKMLLAIGRSLSLC